MTPLGLLQLNLQAFTLAAEVQTVMTLRLLGMAGMIPASGGENSRMIMEKPAAFSHSWFAASSAVMAGKSADQVVEAAMRPLSTKVSANRRRLMR